MKAPMRYGPKTVAELTDWFEVNFCCMQGPGRAWIDIVTGPGAYDMMRFVFESYGVTTHDDVDVENRMVKALFEDFEPLLLTPVSESLLIWRRKPVLTKEAKHKQGELLATAEEIEDGLKSRPSGPDAYIDADGNWYQSLGQYNEWILRTRLVLPALQWHPKTMVTARQAEGAPFKVLS